MGLGGLRISTEGVGSDRVDFDPVGKVIVKNGWGHFEAHATRALACSLLIAALGFASANGCTGGNGTVPDAGELPVNYTFDHGTEGWVLNKREGSSFTNLGAGVPDGGSPPTVTFAASDGDPSPGSLRFTVAFTAPLQYAAAGVVLRQARDLTGKTLHARVRLVSGSAAGVWAGLYGCSSLAPLAGAVCTGGAMAIDAVELAGGAWAPLALDVVAPVPPIGTVPDLFQFTPASVAELGIEVYTVTDADGGASASTGDLVFEIDTVTD